MDFLAVAMAIYIPGLDELPLPNTSIYVASTRGSIRWPVYDLREKKISELQVHISI